MSTNHSNLLTCKCGKTYKTKQPYIKHMHKCQANSDNTDNTDTASTVSDDDNTNEEPPRINRGLAPDAEYLAQIDNDMRNDLQDFMNTKGPYPVKEPLEGENITVNTLVIETLLKTVLSQVLLHHHKHTQSIAEQNAKLIEENKMLLRMVRTLVYNKNNIKFEVDIESDNNSNQDMNDDVDNNDDDNSNTSNDGF
jgi:hypothetical protein